MCLLLIAAGGRWVKIDHTTTVHVHNYGRSNTLLRLILPLIVKGDYLEDKLQMYQHGLYNLYVWHCSHFNSSWGSVVFLSIKTIPVYTCHSYLIAIQMLHLNCSNVTVSWSRLWEVTAGTLLIWIKAFLRLTFQRRGDFYLRCFQFQMKCEKSKTASFVKTSDPRSHILTVSWFSCA